MSLKISVDYKKALAGIEKIKKKMKPEVVDKALDVTLSKDLAALKEKLLNMLNNEQKSKIEVKNQDSGETQINIKKSDEELIKHIYGIDLTKISKTKDYNSQIDHGIMVIANKSNIGSKIDPLNGAPTSHMSSGANLRLPMGPNDTFESHYAQALNYFNNAIFVFVDPNGKSNYYMNPGIDLSRCVKVACSNEAGDTERSRKKFEHYKVGRESGSSDRGGAKEHADWTILKECLDEIKRNFINITDVIDKLKEGELEEAQNIVNKVKRTALGKDNIISKIEDLKKTNNLSPSVESYNNLVKLIKNLKLNKSTSKDKSTYTLVSTYDETIKDYGDFQDKLKIEADLWQVSEEQKWIGTLVKAIIKLAVESLR